MKLITIFGFLFLMSISQSQAQVFIHQYNHNTDRGNLYHLKASRVYQLISTGIILKVPGKLNLSENSAIDSTALPELVKDFTVRYDPLKDSAEHGFPVIHTSHNDSLDDISVTFNFLNHSDSTLTPKFGLRITFNKEINPDRFAEPEIENIVILNSDAMLITDSEELIKKFHDHFEFLKENPPPPPPPPIEKR